MFWLFLADVFLFRPTSVLQHFSHPARPITCLPPFPSPRLPLPSMHVSSRQLLSSSPPATCVLFPLSGSRFRSGIQHNPESDPKTWHTYLSCAAFSSFYINALLPFSKFPLLASFDVHLITPSSLHSRSTPIRSFLSLSFSTTRSFLSTSFSIIVANPEYKHSLTVSYHDMRSSPSSASNSCLFGTLFQSSLGFIIHLRKFESKTMWGGRD